MKKKLAQEIEIPQDVKIEAKENLILVKGPEGEIRKNLNLKGIELKNEGGKIMLNCEKATKREKRQMNTTVAHIKNMIKGVQKRFEYKLKVCFSHFPINVEIKGEEILIKNFLGEKTPRKIAFPEGTEILIHGQEITISSLDKELAGQAAANLERATRITGRDRRIFQDGIFITNKAGRDI